MRLLDEIAQCVEDQLAAGVTKRDEIVAAVRQRFEGEVDMEELLATYFDRRVSLVVARFRDDLGERVAFPTRSESGERVIVDMRFSSDAAAMRATGRRLRRAGQSMVRAGDRLITRADQLELELSRPAA